MKETSRFGAFWKKNYKLVFLFFIRLAEVFVSSIIPSFLGVVLIFINPNKNIWTIINFVTLIGFALINFRFLLKYVAGRRSKKEFYILNSIVYLIYFAVSILTYKFQLVGFIVYSMIFANLRGLEAFGLKTFHSILICDGITLVSLFILGRYAYSHMDLVWKLLKMNGADAVEIFYDEAVPTQNNEEIRTLSIEEMDREIEKEIKEDAEFIKQQQEKLWEGNEHKKAFKGNNEEVEFVIPENPDNDIDETDYVEENAEIINRNAAYDSDSLWENDIYNGKEPITHYDDEYESAQKPEDRSSVGDRLKGMLRHHIRSATRIAVVKRNNRRTEAGFAEDDYDEKDFNEAEWKPNEAYDYDSLWESKMYQGQSAEKISKPDEDFDDADEKPEKTGLEGYDYDNLWNPISRDRILKDSDVIEEENTATETGLEDYDSDSLWSTEVYQGRKK